MDPRTTNRILVPVLMAGIFSVFLPADLSAQISRINQLDRGDPKAIISDLDLRDRPLKDVVDFIRERSGMNIVMDEGIDTRVTLKLKNVFWRDALREAVEKAGAVVIQRGRNILKIEKPPRVNFFFDRADITLVIDAISKISGANIITAPEVQGTITLRLRDVPWRDALEQIVKTLNFTVVEEDRKILRVVSPSSLQEQLVRKEFQLRYVRPPSVFVPTINSQYVRGQLPMPSGDPADSFNLLSALRRMLSSTGRLEYVSSRNIILVRDTKPVIDDMERIIAVIDTEPRQVFVDVKFVTTRNTDLYDVGVSIGDTGLKAALSMGSIPTILPFDLGKGGFEDSLIVYTDRARRGPFGDPTLNAGTTTTIPNTVFGTLDFTGVSMVLNLLQKDDTSEIVQAPKIIALDHTPATIFVGDTIRFAQASAEAGQSGGLSLVVQEASGSPVQTGFQLLLVPHIIPGTDMVMLEVIPESESLSGSGGPPLAPAGFDVFTVGSGTGSGTIALPRISSSTIATKMMLQSGQTAVIGGLTTETNTKTVTQVPFLGSIPIFGWLFKNEIVSSTHSSLIVFITPEIVASPEDTAAAVRRLLEKRRRMLESEYREIFGASGKLN